VEDKTGDRETMKKARKCNRRLKDLFVSAAIDVVRNDPNSHLAGYHRNLVKRGMEPTEAIKRVARALVRVIYRELMELIQAEGQEPEPKSSLEGQSGVASGRGRGDKQHLSNTPPRSQNTSTTRPRKQVKRTAGRTTSTGVVRRKRVRLEERA
jgi:hypothetical protein